MPSQVGMSNWLGLLIFSSSNQTSEERNVITVGVKSLARMLNIN